MVWKTSASGSFSSGRRRTVTKEIQKSVFYSKKYGDGDIILLGTRYIDTSHKHLKNNVISFTDLNSHWSFILLVLAALVLILLSTLMKRTNVEQQVLFGLYMIQVHTGTRFGIKYKNFIWCLRCKSLFFFFYFRLPVCPCKVSWTVWFTPGDDQTSRRPFSGRTPP